MARTSKTETAKAVKETAKEAVAETKEAAKKVSEEVKETVKEAVADTKEAVKETVAETKEAAKKAVEKEETVKTAAKKTTAKKAADKKEDLKPEVFVQFAGHEAVVAEVIEKAKKQFEAEGHRASSIKSIKVYLKPEEYAAYYVINQKHAGKVDLF